MRYNTKADAEATGGCPVYIAAEGLWASVPDDYAVEYLNFVDDLDSFVEADASRLPKLLAADDKNLHPVCGEEQRDDYADADSNDIGGYCRHDLPWSACPECGTE